MKKALRQAELEREILKKAVSIFSASDRFIKTYGRMYPVEQMYRLLKVSRSAYYNWLSKLEQCAARKELLDKAIVSVFEDSLGTYGSPRIAEDLANKGTIISKSKSTIARRMNYLNIKARIKKK